jgi:hypothetical protein
MKGLLGVIFVFLNTSISAQELPDSVLNITWEVDQITTAEHSIPSDTIVKWMAGKALTVRIEQRLTKCFPDQVEMKYRMRTSVCNTCSYQFNMMENRVSGCLCKCQAAWCTDGKGNLSGQGKLEHIFIPVLCRTTSISVKKNQMKLVTEDGAEVILKK